MPAIVNHMVGEMVKGQARKWYGEPSQGNDFRSLI
jgi:hypothetical protein